MSLIKGIFIISVICLEMRINWARNWNSTFWFRTKSLQLMLMFL